MTPSTRILLHGVTGRMGRKRHLLGALVPLRDSGSDIDLVLTGRSKEELELLGRESGASIEMDMDVALKELSPQLFFDASNPQLRPKLLQKALLAGVGVYTEKPLALTLDQARGLHDLASRKNLFTGIVQDKLFTPGFRAARLAVNEELLGEIFDIRCEFGYWVETGNEGKPMNRPSWNFQENLGGSLISDLYSHWNYIIELIDEIKSVSAIAKTHIPNRVAEDGKPFKVSIPDVAHVIFQTEKGITGSISTSWIQRPLVPFTMRIFGSKASMRATPDECKLVTDSGEECLISRFGITTEDEFLAQWREVISGIKNGSAVKFDFKSAVRQAALCAAIEKSVIEKRFVTLERGATWAHLNFPLMG